MKRIFPLILPIIALIIVGCSNDDALEVEAIEKTEGFIPVGNQVEVTLSLSTLPFTVDEETRAEDPDNTYEPTSEDETQMLTDEKYIDRLWVFEYDKETGKLIGFPQYFTLNPRLSEITDFKVKLSDNYGAPVIIYVVADADAGTSATSNQNWVVYDKDKKTYPGFETIDALEANTLPTTYISETQRDYSGYNSWPPYYYRSNTGETLYDDATCIPKSGSVEVEKVEESVEVAVQLTNMYAKLMLYVDFTNCDLTYCTNDYISYRFAIDNIPNYCTVKPLADAETTTRGAYPSSVVWGCYGAPYYSRNNSSLLSLYNYNESSAVLLETIYVPENIQGDNSSYSRTSSTYPPVSEGKITSGATLYEYSNFPTQYSDISVYDKTDALAIYFAWDWYGQRSSTSSTNATHYLGWYGPVFPGGNTTTNFNMRRNCTYRVILHFSENGFS